MSLLSRINLLLCRSQRVLCNNLWMNLVKNNEREFFKKRSDQYLHYVETELIKGRTIRDLMVELQSLEKRLPIKLSQINDRVKQEDYYIDKNKKFVAYIRDETDKGRHLDEVLAEIRRTIALAMHKEGVINL